MPLWRIMGALCAGCALICLGATGFQKLAERKIDGFWMVPQTHAEGAYPERIPDETRIRLHDGRVDIHQSAMMTSMAADVTLLLDGKPHAWKSEASVFCFPSEMHAYEAYRTASGFVVTEYLTQHFTGVESQTVTSWTMTDHGKHLVINDRGHTVTYRRVTRMRELFLDRL